MTTHDDRTPRPTDPPIDPISSEIAPDTDEDTEGHSLNGDFARTIAREHVREVDRIPRDSARVRESKKGSEGGFLKRFSRR